MQAQLLRVLQEGEIRRVGGTEAIQVDVRVVAATNRELEDEVKAGRFREDLYFRINVVTIRLPPLRERPSDIPLLVEHFLVQVRGARAARRRRRGARRRWRCCSATPGRATCASWRTSSSARWRCRRTASSCRRICRRRSPSGESPAAGAAARRRGIVDDRPTLAELERRYIELILRETGGNKKRAAEILGIDRRTLYRTLEREGRAAEADEDDATDALWNVRDHAVRRLAAVDLGCAAQSGTLQVALEFEERYLRFDRRLDRRPTARTIRWRAIWGGCV